METLLSERNKTLAAYALFFLILLLPVIFHLVRDELPEQEEIGRGIQNRIARDEAEIGAEIAEMEARSAELYKRYRASLLRHEEMVPGESVILVEDGVIESYFGEVFYFRTPELKAGEWNLTRKEDYLYYTRSLEEDVFFIQKYRVFSEVFGSLKDRFPFISEEIRFLSSPAREIESRLQYDENFDSYYIYHISETANRQLYLSIKFSTADYSGHRLRQARKGFLIFYLFLLCIFCLLLPRRFRLLKTGGLILFGASLFFLIRLFADHSIHITLPGFEVKSVLMFFYFSFLAHLLLTRVSAALKGALSIYCCVPVSMILSLFLSVVLIRSVTFAYMNFTLHPNYILFILSLFMLIIIPFRILDKNDIPRTGKGIFLFIASLAAATAVSVFFLKVSWQVPAGISAVLLVNYLYRGNLLFETLRALAVSAILFMLVFFFSQSEKMRFTSEGLKKIFANQNNYAKFISRELIHNIHQWNEDLAVYFQAGRAGDLENIWRRSIAFKENISSGIYVLSADKKIINSFSYRIPYLEVSTDETFPFWMIDEFKAEYFGRTISVAVASINIFERENYLGKIIIQVINSSELITSDRPESNIFTLNNRIDGKDISYIKLNKKMQIIENPSNIDIGNMSRLAGEEENWIRFEFMDTKFSGYMFENNEDTLIVFSPVTPYSEILSNIIKIFLLLLLATAAVNIRNVVRWDWRTIFRTFSVRVFAILILISLFSAIFFSLFSIQFNQRNREIEYRRQVFNNGGVAYNLISDTIQQNKSLEKDDLFYLSKILNSDISLYQNHRLLATSNYNRIIRSEIPVMINSNIPMLLDESERFFIDRENGESRIFFNVGEYIVRLDFSGISRDILTRPEMFSNFIINLFFVLTVMGILLAFIFRKKILSPINILNFKMSKVEKGELEEISEIPAEIELRSLFDGFNSMVAGVREQKKSVSDIARMKTMIKLSRWIAHEVKNPLTPIKLSAEQILMSLKDKRENYEDLINQSVKYIIDETEHLRKISLGFLDISNLDKLEVSRFDLRRLCENEIVKLGQVYKNIQFSFHCPGQVPEVEMDRIKITQVLKNLLSNAVESIKKRKGEIRLGLEYRKGIIHISLEDNGSGIGGNVSGKLFDEDFSTKSSGTGLGLFIVKRIVDLHRGTIEFHSSDSGTRVSLSMPQRPAGGGSGG